MNNNILDDPELLKILGLDVQKGAFYNTFNNEANLVAYVKANSNLIKNTDNFNKLAEFINNNKDNISFKQGLLYLYDKPIQESIEVHIPNTISAMEDYIFNNVAPYVIKASKKIPFDKDKYGFGKWFKDNYDIDTFKSYGLDTNSIWIYDSSDKQKELNSLYKKYIQYLKNANVELPNVESDNIWDDVNLAASSSRKTIGLDEKDFDSWMETDSSYLPTVLQPKLNGVNYDNNAIMFSRSAISNELPDTSFAEWVYDNTADTKSGTTALAIKDYITNFENNPTAEGLNTYLFFINKFLDKNEVTLKSDEHTPVTITIDNNGNISYSNKNIPKKLVLSKLKGGAVVTSNSHNGLTYSDIIKSVAFIKALKSIDANNYLLYNALLDSFVNLNPDTDSNGKLRYLNDVYNYQNLFNSLGFNSAFEEESIKNKLINLGGTTDNSLNGWADGYYGAMTGFRHFGKSGEVTNDEVASINGIVQSKGLKYYLPDGETMYKFGLLDGAATSDYGFTAEDSKSSKTFTKENSNNLSKTFTPETDNDSSENVQTEISGEIKPQRGNLLPRLLAIAAEFGDASATNAKMQLQGHLDPKFLPSKPKKQAIVREGIEHVAAGQQSAARYLDVATQGSTRDSALNAAQRLTATFMGEKDKVLGKNLSNQIYDTSVNKALEVLNENALIDWENATRLAQAIHEASILNQANKLARTLKDYTNRSITRQSLLKTLEDYWTNKESKRISLAEKVAPMAVYSNPKAYIKDLTDEELRAYTKGKDGNSYKLNSKEYDLYLSVKTRLDNIVTQELARLYGIDVDVYTNIIANSIKNLPKEKKEFTKIQLREKGGKLKERIANAERFYKSVRDQLDRSEKSLDRLFKCLQDIKRKW